MKTLRHLLYLVVSFSCGVLSPSLQAATASPPSKLTFQGFLTDNTGAPLGPSAPVQRTIIFKVYPDASSTSLKWGEQQVVTVDKGHFSVLLGEGTTVDGSIMSPRILFVASPYALLAKTANQLLDDAGAVALRATAGTVIGNGSGLTNINGVNIASATITTAQIVNLAVTTAKIADLGVTTAKIADLNVTTAKIAALAVTDAKIASAPTSANTASTIVKRDANGAFLATRVYAATDVQVNSQSVVTGAAGY